MLVPRSLEHANQFAERVVKCSGATKIGDIDVPKGITIDEIFEQIRNFSISDDAKASLRRILDENKSDPSEAYRKVMWKHQRSFWADKDAERRKLPFSSDIIPFEQQRLLVELMSDERIGLVSVVGPQGTGKTLMALYNAMLLLAEGKYSRVTYFKPLVALGEDLGYLPGGKGEKMRPWMQPYYDALLQVFGGKNARRFSGKSLQQIAALEKDGVLGCEVLTYQLGTTWFRELVLFDDAQLLTRQQMNLVVGRVGEGSKLVLLGDPFQIAKETPHLSIRNNGLSHVIDRLFGDSLYGHITLPTTCVKRSEVAKLAQLL